MYQKQLVPTGAQTQDVATQRPFGYSKLPGLRLQISRKYIPALPDLIKQGKFAEADTLFLRSIAIEEKALGPDHPSLAISLNNRAELLAKQVMHRFGKVST